MALGRIEYMDSKITINIVEPGSGPTPDPATPNTGLFTSGIGGPEATIITAVSAVLLLTIAAIVVAVCYRKQKKAGKVTKLVHIIDSTKAMIISKKRLSAALTAIALLVSAGTFVALAKNGVNASEGDEQSQAEGTNDSSLTVDVSSEELTIEVADEPVFAVLPVEVTVEEATEAGYTLTAYTDNTDLVSTTNPDNIIPMVTLPESSAETLESSETAGELTALTDNTYGLALGEEPTTKDAAVYMPLSIDSDIPTIINSMPEYTPTEENDTTIIYYGFYITPDTPYGTYTNDSEVYYNATINTTPVTFDGNGLYFNNEEQQTTTNEVEYIAVPEEGKEYNINQIVSGEYKEPSQDLPYNFLGWSTDSTATVPTYETEEKIAEFLPISPNTPITLYAVWQKATTITYDGNGADSGTMDTQTIIAGESDSLYENAFVKDGYHFTGWNTVAEPTEQEPGETYADQADYTAPATSQYLTLYVQWEEDALYMQNVSEWGNSLEIGDEITAVDSRDGTEYTVARLADNKIWMTQNLDLELNTKKTLTPADTNITADWTPANSTISFTGTDVPGWQDDNYVPYSADLGPLYVYSSGTTSNDEQYTSLEACKETHPDCSAKNHAGNYYNWSAAVANNNTAGITKQSTNVETSICPAGWRLPTGRDSGNTAAGREWNAVLYAEGVASSPTGDGYKSGGFNKIRTAPLWLARSGYVRNGSLDDTGGNGFYWSSTVRSSSDAYRLYFDSGSVLPAFYSGRYYGCSVRCVAQ